MKLRRSLGYAVEALLSAASSAISKSRQTRLLDYNARGELYACLIELGRNIPIILATAHPNEAVRSRSLKDGIVYYL